MINFLKQNIKKYFNFKKEVIVEHAFMVIRIFKINKGDKINNLIHLKLKEEFYDYKDFLIHSEIIKNKEGKFVVVYIIKNTNELQECFTKYENLKIIPYQFKISSDILSKIKSKKISGLCTVKYKNNICVLSYVNGVLTSFQMQNSDDSIEKILIEEEEKYKKNFDCQKKLYVEKELIKSFKEYKGEDEVVVI